MINICKRFRQVLNLSTKQMTFRASAQIRNINFKNMQNYNNGFQNITCVRVGDL